MGDSTVRFTGRAQAYDLYRQRYPAEEVLALLRSWFGLQTHWHIADVGAGTGMLSEVFLQNDNSVTAIEPNKEMRAQCETLRVRWPRLRILDATAEATSLPDASVEMVSAGRAFHWFDAPLALAEFRRILKPRGYVVLVSAGRAHVSTEAALAFEQLLVDFGTDHSYARTKYRIHDQLEQLFPAELHQVELPGEQRLDWAALHGFTHSLSVVPRNGEPGYDVFEEQLRRYFVAYALNSVLTMQTTCWISAGRV